jgi:hypothetical protein
MTNRTGAPGFDPAVVKTPRPCRRCLSRASQWPFSHPEAVIAPGQSCQSPPASPLSSPSPPSRAPRCRRSCWLFGLHLLLPLPPTRGAVLPAAQSRLATRTARCSRVPAALGYLPPAGVASPSLRARCGVVARRPHPRRPRRLRRRRAPPAAAPAVAEAPAAASPVACRPAEAPRRLRAC